MCSSRSIRFGISKKRSRHIVASKEATERVSSFILVEGGVLHHILEEREVSSHLVIEKGVPGCIVVEKRVLDHKAAREGVLDYVVVEEKTKERVLGNIVIVKKSRLHGKRRRKRR